MGCVGWGGGTNIQFITKPCGCWASFRGPPDLLCPAPSRSQAQLRFHHLQEAAVDAWASMTHLWMSAAPDYWFGKLCTSKVHILLKPSLKDFEHYLASLWNECNCAIVWTFFDTALLWDWDRNWSFPVLWTLLSFPNLLECINATKSRRNCGLPIFIELYFFPKFLRNYNGQNKASHSPKHVLSWCSEPKHVLCSLAREMSVVDEIKVAYQLTLR